MIAGTLILEDHTIVFTVDNATQVAHWTVCDSVTGKTDVTKGPAPDLMAALGIALHYEGNPNATRDYPAAESTQRSIRWIP